MKRQLFVILLIMVLLVSGSSAGAASFSDVSGDTESAVFRLSVLGIIDGYPDGTFRPENSITRAEFSKIAVIAMGLERILELPEDASSRFSDVKPDDWYNKYVNAATEHGILKGYTGGTFKPNEPITEAEAVTIILRILGYSDELPGSWPYNYAAQADQIGLINANDFTVGATATRGYIARLLNDALSAESVDWNAFSGFYTTGYSLLADSFNGEILERVNVYSTRKNDDKYNTMIVLDEEDNAVSLRVSKDVIIHGTSFNDLADHFVTCITVNNIVAGIDILSRTVTGEVEAVNFYTRVVTIDGNDLEYSYNIDLPQKGASVTAYIYNGLVYASH